MVIYLNVSTCSKLSVFWQIKMTKSKRLYKFYFFYLRLFPVNLRDNKRKERRNDKQNSQDNSQLKQYLLNSSASVKSCLKIVSSESSSNAGSCLLQQNGSNNQCRKCNLNIRQNAYEKRHVKGLYQALIVVASVYSQRSRTVFWIDMEQYIKEKVTLEYRAIIFDESI